MEFRDISVTFYYEGAVTLIRSAKNVTLKAHTSETTIGNFTYNGEELSSHDVDVEPNVVTRKLNLEPFQYLNMPSRTQLRNMGIHGSDRKKTARNWNALPVEKKIVANLADLAHDLGAESYAWYYTD